MRKTNSGLNWGPLSTCQQAASYENRAKSPTILNIWVRMTFRSVGPVQAWIFFLRLYLRNCLWCIPHNWGDLWIKYSIPFVLLACCLWIQRTRSSKTKLKKKLIVIITLQTFTAHVCWNAAGSMFICNGGIHSDSYTGKLSSRKLQTHST